MRSVLPSPFKSAIATADVPPFPTLLVVAAENVPAAAGFCMTRSAGLTLVVQQLRRAEDSLPHGRGGLLIGPIRHVMPDVTRLHTKRNANPRDRPASG